MNSEESTVGISAFGVEHTARVNRVGLYREAAVLAGVAAPAALLRSSVLIDGRIWNGRDPGAYISSFANGAPRPVFGHGAPQ